MERRQAAACSVLLIPLSHIFYGTSTKKMHPGHFFLFLAFASCYTGAMSQITKSLIKQLGPENIARACGVSTGAVDNASREPLLPARWYWPLCQLGQDRGVAVPPGFFRWAEPKDAG
jgi:hypothetical protein